jgi:hypothetical protein
MPDSIIPTPFHSNPKVTSVVFTASNCARLVDPSLRMLQPRRSNDVTFLLFSRACAKRAQPSSPRNVSENAIVLSAADPDAISCSLAVRDAILHGLSSEGAYTSSKQHVSVGPAFPPFKSVDQSFCIGPLPRQVKGNRWRSISENLNTPPAGGLRCSRPGVASPWRSRSRPGRLGQPGRRPGRRPGCEFLTGNHSLASSMCACVSEREREREGV